MGYERQLHKKHLILRIGSTLRHNDQQGSTLQKDLIALASANPL